MCSGAQWHAADSACVSGYAMHITPSCELAQAEKLQKPDFPVVRSVEIIRRKSALGSAARNQHTSRKTAAGAQFVSAD
jgi:hypothetical protein